MAEDNENSSIKKRRIIHWNPDAGREQAKRRWTWKRIVIWSVGGFFGLLIVAGIIIRGVKLVLGPDVFQRKAVVTSEGPNIDDANAAFVSQTKAEQAHQMATK